MLIFGLMGERGLTAKSPESGLTTVFTVNVHVSFRNVHPPEMKMDHLKIFFRVFRVFRS